MRHGLVALVVLATASACGNGSSADDDATAGRGGDGASAGSSVGGGSASGGASAAGGSAGSVTAGDAGSGGTSSGGSSGMGTGGGSSGMIGGSGGTVSPSAGNSGAAGRADATGGGSGTGAGAGGSGGGSAGMSPAAGAGGSAGAAPAVPSTGCGVADFPPAQKNSLMVDGTAVAREFIVALPAGYDPGKPYRVVFAFHGLTGTAEQIAGNGFSGGYYGLSSRIGDSTILVAPQGLAPDDQPDQYGWPNTGGRDIAFVRAMVDWLGSSYCVDQARIFSIGFSYGGIMSDTIGCEMADVFRGIAPIAGAVFGRGCAGPPIAAFMVHGTADDQVAYTDGEAARDLIIAKNHCDASVDPTPVAPEGCSSYAGCDAGYPVVWCSHAGGHMVPSFAAQGISDFVSQF